MGDRITDVLDRWRASGHQVVYSTTLVSADLVVRTAPNPASSTLEQVRAVLAPHGLTLERVDDIFVVTEPQERSAAPAKPGTLLLTVKDALTGEPIVPARIELSPTVEGTPGTHSPGSWRLDVPAGRYRVTVDAVGYEAIARNISVTSGRTRRARFDLTSSAATLETVQVSASYYEILRELLGSKSLISQRAIQYLPDFGEDPIRAVRRLPGTASGGASAKSFIRGGEEDETAIFLNGQRLLDPFHVRDYQNLFSAIDVRAIDGVEVYTGGFPAKYGDRLSGLILIDTLTPELPRHSEIGLSVFNTSILSAGTVAEGDAQWLFSARRGNLDLVLDPTLGEPSYYDVFAEIGVNLTESSQLSVNALVSNDDALIITENDPTEREQSDSTVRNASFWIHWNQDWRENLNSRTTLSVADFTSRRIAFIDDPESIIGEVDDRREVNIAAIRQDWTYTAADKHLLTFGWEYQRQSGSYDYRSQVDYLGLFTILADVPDSRRTAFARSVDGDSLAAYVSDRLQVNKRTYADIGVRWDKQTYTDTINDEQFSPRFSVMHELSDSTSISLSLGRYYQSQGLHELQVEDGTGEYFPAQRADQAILGFQRQFANDYALRIEAYWKEMRRLRPRYENLYDPLAVIPELEPDRVRIAPQEARARGIEFSLARGGPAGFSWWGTYTLANVEDLIDGDYQPRSWDQRHALQLGLAWSNEHWDFGLVGNIHSGWPKTDVSFAPGQAGPQPEVVFGRRNADRFATFRTLDLRVGYNKPLRGGEFSLFFELSNATNRENPCCVDFDLDSDPNGNLILEQEDDNWLPLLPAVGVLWTF